MVYKAYFKRIAVKLRLHIKRYVYAVKYPLVECLFAAQFLPVEIMPMQDHKLSRNSDKAR